MPITTLSSRAFNQDTGAAKKAAGEGPVIITDRGKPSHVLLTIAEYRRLSSSEPTLADVFAALGAGAVAFEPPRLFDRPPVPADLS